MARKVNAISTPRAAELKISHSLKGIRIPFWLEFKIPCGQKCLQTQRSSTGELFRLFIPPNTNIRNVIKVAVPSLNVPERRSGRRRFLFDFIYFLLWCAFIAKIGMGLEVAFCDGINAFHIPDSPAPLPESPPQDNPPMPIPQPVPVVPEPLLTDPLRNSILYQRYLTLHFGVGDPGDLGRMVSIISNQVLIEKGIEQALLQDGWSPRSILANYPNIRGLIHAPQGRLMSPQTYAAYVDQINEQGTRQSAPYRRILRAIANYDIFLVGKSKKSIGSERGGQVGLRTVGQRKGKVLIPGRSRMTRECHVRFL